MLYLQLKERVILLPGQRLTVGDLADGVGEGAAEAMKQPVPCWLNTGVWRLPAAALVQAVLPVCGQVTTLGPAEVMVHVQAEKKRAAGGLRTAAAFTRWPSHGFMRTWACGRHRALFFGCWQAGNRQIRG